MFALYANCGRYSNPYFYKLTLPYVDIYLSLNPLLSFTTKLRLLASRKN